MKKEQNYNDNHHLNVDDQFQSQQNHQQTDQKSIKIMKYDIINISNSFSTLKKVAPEIITDKMVQTLFAELFKRYGKNQNIAKSFFHQTIKMDKKYNIPKNREIQRNLINSQSLKKINREKERQYESVEALDDPPSVKEYKKKIVSRSFCYRNRSFAALQDQIFQSKQKIHIGKQQYEILLSDILIQSFQRLEQFLIEHCKKAIDPLDKSIYQPLVKTVSNCRIFFTGQACQTLFNIIKGIYQLEVISPVKEDNAYVLYQAIMQELKGELGINLNQSAYKQSDQNQNQNKKMSQIERIRDGNKQKDQITIMKDKYGVECLTKVKSSKKEGREFELSSYWSGVLQQKLLNLYCQQHNFIQIRDQFINLYPMGKQLFTTAAIRSQFNKIMRVAIRKLIYFTNTFGKGKLPLLQKLNDHRVKIIIYHNEGYFIRKLLIQIYRKDVYDQKILSRVINCINDFVDKHGQFKSRGERQDQDSNNEQGQYKNMVKQPYSKSLKQKFKDKKNSKNYMNKNKEQKNQNKKKIKRFNPSLPLKSQIVYKGCEEGDGEQQEIVENINEWLQNQYK